MTFQKNRILSHGFNYGIAFVIILVLNFVLPRLMPGDPMTAMYGQDVLAEMSPELQQKIRETMGLSQPMWKQFAGYITSVLSGDLGYSVYHSRSVLSVTVEYLKWTLLLSGTALIAAFLIGVLLGLESGWKRGSLLDRSLVTGLMCISGLPGFFVGILLLLIFSLGLGIFPAQGAVTPYAGLSGPALAWDIVLHLVLPACALTLAFTPGYFLLMRNSLLGVTRESFVLTAQSKGLEDSRVKYVHAGRNALLPVVTASGIHLSTRLITGALFVEIVFSYPGMGSLIYQAVRTRDYPVLQGSLFILTVMILIVNFCVDAAYNYLDPRIRHAH